MFWLKALIRSNFRLRLVSRPQLDDCECMAPFQKISDYEIRALAPTHLDNFAFSCRFQGSSQPSGYRGSNQFLERCLSLETPPVLIVKCTSVPSVDEFVPTSTISPSTWSFVAARDWCTTSSGLG